jgi:hypothetical protein
MQAIEIRQNKKSLIPTLALLIAGWIGLCYITFFSDKIANNYIRIFNVIMIIAMAYSFYFPIRKLIKNEPILILSEFGIEINEKIKPVSLSWLQIIDWNIEKEKDNNTFYLILKTEDKNRRINISWLQKTPGEIEELVQVYHKKKLN